MQNIFKTAIDIQDASNVSGVVHEFSRAMPIIRHNGGEAGSKATAEHPVTVLFVNKLVDMTGGLAADGYDSPGFTAAYAACLAKAGLPVCPNCGFVGTAERIAEHRDQGYRNCTEAIDAALRRAALQPAGA